MRLAAIRPHKKYGSAIFTKPSIDIIFSEMIEVNVIEVISIDLGKCTVISVYKPPNSPFKFHKPKNFAARNVRIILEDFNCHSTSWVYNETNDDGHSMVAWAVSKGLNLIGHKLPPSFNSGRWKCGYNPDLIFLSEAISIQCFKKMCEPIPSTQHRVIQCDISAAIIPFRRRFNFRKADWTAFAKELDEIIGCLCQQQ